MHSCGKTLLTEIIGVGLRQTMSDVELILERENSERKTKLFAPV